MEVTRGDNGGGDVLCSVGGVRNTPATCLSPPSGPCPDLWFAQGTTTGSVLLFSVPLGKGGEMADEAAAPGVSLHFDDSEPVSSLVWNASRRQLSVVHAAKVTFFYICMDPKNFTCTELQTHQHSRSIRALRWLSLDPVVVLVDEDSRIFAYNTAHRKGIELRTDGVGGQATVAVGRYLDEIASFGDEDSKCLLLWDGLSGSLSSKLRHTTSLRCVDWCCTADQCVLVTATEQSMHVWSKSHVGKAGFYIQQREIALDYRIDRMVCLSPFVCRGDGRLRHSAMILGVEEGTFVLHRYMALLSLDHLPVVSRINSLRLLLDQIGASTRGVALQFSAFPFAGGKHLISLCTNQLLSLWEVSNKDIAFSGQQTHTYEVGCFKCAPTVNGNQSQVRLVRFSGVSGAVFTADADNCIHVWRVGQDQKIELVHEFSAQTEVIDASWACGNAAGNSQKILVVLEKALLILSLADSNVKEEVEKWSFPCDFGCSLKDMVLLSFFEHSADAFSAHFAGQDNSVLSIDITVGAKSTCVPSSPMVGQTISLQGSGVPRKVSCSRRNSGSSHLLHSKNDELVLASVSNEGVVEHLLKDWDQGSQVLRSTLSNDRRYLFVLARKDLKYKILVWKSDMGTSDFSFHSTVTSSREQIAFDVICLPCLPPVVLTCGQGKASIHNFGETNSLWKALCVSEGLPEHVSDVQFLNSSRMLVASNQELLTVRMSISKSCFGDHLCKKDLDGIQKHLTSLYNPFDIVDTRSLKECIVQGKFGLLQKQSLLLFEYAKVYRGRETLDESPGDENRIRDLYAGYFEGDELSRGGLPKEKCSEDTETLAKMESVLRKNSNLDFGPKLWRLVFKTGMNVQETFLNASGMSSINKKVILSYIYRRQCSMTESDGNADKGFQNYVSEEKFWGVSEVDGIWGLLSKDKDVLLQCISDVAGKLVWSEVRLSGLGYWIDSKVTALSLFEKIAKSEFLRKRDPHHCALFYLALNKVNVLGGLCRATNNTKLGDFLKRNFDEDANLVAALKNAYALLGQHRYELAAAFFLLARKPEDAIEVCVKNLGDVQLGISIALLQSTDEKDLRTNLIEKTLMNGAKERKAFHECLLYKIMLKDYGGAMKTLTSMVIQSERWASLEASLTSAEFFHLIHLIGGIYNELLERNEAQCELELAFILRYTSIVASAGHSGLCIWWAKLVAKRMPGFPDHHQSIVQVLSGLIGNALISYTLSLHFAFSVPLPALVRRFEDMSFQARGCLELDLQLNGKEMLSSLDVVLRVFRASENSRAEALISNPRGARTKAGKSTPSVVASVIHQFPKSVKALKFNTCNPREATVSTSSGLHTAKFKVPASSPDCSIDTEPLFQSRFPKDSWTVPIVSEHRRRMPQWAVLNISKAEVPASVISVHPHRPLFVSNFMNDVMLLWHFQQQSAMSCYRLPSEKVKAKAKSFSFDSSGEKICCIYSTGSCAVFNVDALPSNGTSIDYDVCRDLFGEGKGADATFYGNSSSVLLAAGCGGLSLWDTLQPRAHRISLRKMGRPTRLHMPSAPHSHTFLCGGADGSVALFDIRRLAPAMIPLWCEKEQADTGVVQFAGGLSGRKLVASLHEDGKCKVFTFDSKRRSDLLLSQNSVTYMDAVGDGLALCNKDALTYVS